MSKRVLIRAGLFVLFSIGASQGCSSREAENVDEQSSKLDPSDAEAGSCVESVTLESTRFYHPIRIVPGIATFSPAVDVVVPSEIPVVVGASSDRRAVLTLQHGDDRIWCFYRGEPPGTRYAFRYCSTVDEPEDNGDVCDANSRPHAGDAVTVDRVVLRVLNGDSTNAAGKTTVRVTLEVRCGDGGAADASSDVADVSTSDVTDATADAPVEATAEANLCAGVVCQAQDACHVAGTCDPNTGQCSNPAAADGTNCNDGNACTKVDTCHSGVCVGSNPVVCGASDQCHAAGSCDPTTGACTNPAAPNGTACNDGNACTQSDTCQNGACVGSNPVICTALDQCHGIGVCDPGSGACTNPIVADNTPCNDGNACTLADSCQSGICTGGAPVTCVASDACHVPGVCNPSTGACTEAAAPDGTACDDADACTQSDSCQAGACVGSSPVTCSASDQCHDVGTCNPQTGTCSNPAKADGSSCNDGNACTQGDVCVAGACTAGAPVTCTAIDQCHTAGVCQPDTGTCSNPAIPGCDPTPTSGDAPFETRASVVGRVVDRSGNGFSGYTLTVLDAAPPTGGSATPRSDIVVQTGSDGSFRARLSTMPETETEHTPPVHVLIRIESASTIPAVREAFLHPGAVLDVGAIKVVPRDSNVTVVGPAGGTAVDSRNLVQVVFPAGALNAPTPIVITPFDARDEIPYPLPTSTATTYAVELEPSGLTFPAGALPTVRLANTRNLPTSMLIPVGSVNESTGEWSHEGLAAWDGQRFAFNVTHFTPYDANNGIASSGGGGGAGGAGGGPPPGGGGGGGCDPNAQCCDPGGGGAGGAGGGAGGGGGGGGGGAGGGDGDPDDAEGGAGSDIAYHNGGLRERIPLPSVRRREQRYGVTLTYDSYPTFGTSNPSGNSGYGAVASTGISMRARNTRFQLFGVQRPSGDLIQSSTPGGCGVFANGLIIAPPGMRAVMSDGFGHARTIPIQDGTLEYELDTPVVWPLADSGAFPAPGYVQTTLTILGPSTSCVGSGSTFGVTATTQTPVTVASSGDPLMVQPRSVFVGHKHASAFGVGWGAQGFGRIHKNPFADEATLLGGHGETEHFSPRPHARELFNNEQNGQALARDEVTGEIFVARAQGEIAKLDPVSGVRTTQLAGVSFGGMPYAMAVVYVAGVRHFVVAVDTRLVDIDAAGSLRVLKARSPVAQPFPWEAPGVAGRNGWVFYAEGNPATPVLYRFRLTDAAPVAEALSLATGGDIALDPKGPISGFSFGDVHGLAMSQSGGLYVAERRRNLVYEVLSNASGEIAPDSKLSRVVGDGSTALIAPLGARFAGRRFAMNQPIFLSTNPDGTLWIGTRFGAALYDPQATEVRWLAFDGNVPSSELTFELFNLNFQSSFVGLGASSFLTFSRVAFGISLVRTDVDVYSSEYNPTRTLSPTPAGFVLTDTKRDFVEAYDGRGRLIERRKRSGDLIFGVTYADATSDRIAQIVDPVGGATTFAYTGGKLASITDAAGRVTTVTVDARGDLTDLVLPDGQHWSFEYEAHRMTKKTTPRGDVSLYTYRPNGTVETSTKPAREVFTLNASLDSATRSMSGRIVRTGSYTDAHGVTHAFTLDDRGQVVRDQFVADGVAYDRVKNVPSTLTSGVSTGVRNQIGRFVSRSENGLLVTPDMFFDEYGRITRVEVQQGQVLETYAYRSDGRLASSFRGPANTDTAYEYDPSGRLARSFERFNGASTGRETRMTYRADGLVDTRAEHDVVTQHSYDAFGNLSATLDTLGRSTAATHDAAGNVATQNDGATTWTYVYDAYNRLQTASDALGNTTALGYAQPGCACPEGDLVTSIHTPDLPADKQWTLTYGPENRLASVIDPDGRAESYSYEPTGELNSIQDRLGRFTTMTHDQLGRVKDLVDSLSRGHRRVYPVGSPSGYAGPSLFAGGASSATPPTALASTLADGDYQVGENGYDLISFGGGGVRSQAQPQQTLYRDATIDVRYSLQFDYASRLVDRRDTSTSGGNFLESFGYNISTADPVVGLITTGGGRADLSYNQFYDLAFANGFRDNRNFNVQYGYARDTGGRVTKIDRTWVFHVVDGFATGPSTTYTYYPNGKLQTRNGADGNFTFTYDARGLLQTETIVIGPDTEVYSFEYDALGRNNVLTFPDGHRREQQYDNQGRITSRCYKYTNPLLDRCYAAEYDAVGNPTRLTDPEGVDIVEYDALDRVKKVTRQRPSLPDVVEDYDYNALGALKLNAGVALDMRRPRLDGGGLADSALPNTFNGQPVVVDPVGRITSLDGMTLTYTQRGQLLNATVGATTATYGFDSFYRRISTTSPSVTEFYVIEDENIVATTNFGSSVQDRYVYDGIDHPLRLKRGGAVVYYEIDLANNVRRLRGAGGNDIGGYRYSAFGKAIVGEAGTPTPTIDQPMRWKGRWQDALTGLYDVRARQWDPGIGAFTEIDEFGRRLEALPASDVPTESAAFGVPASWLTSDLRSRLLPTGFGFHEAKGTLWGWPSANPILFGDPTGRQGEPCTLDPCSDDYLKAKCEDYANKRYANCLLAYQKWYCDQEKPRDYWSCFNREWVACRGRGR